MTNCCFWEQFQITFVIKKPGLPLGTGSPGRRDSVPVSFSHRRVGSSILASLSEAGGYEPQKPQASPFPLACNSLEPAFETRLRKG